MRNKDRNHFNFDSEQKVSPLRIAFRSAHGNPPVGMTMSHFFTIGLYPSLISLVRMASASLISENGPTCT